VFYSYRCMENKITGAILSKSFATIRIKIIPLVICYRLIVLHILLLGIANCNV
jgi:hypothetical protein